MTQEEKIKIEGLKVDILDYLRKYNMYPCTQQIMEHTEYLFNELIDNLKTNNKDILKTHYVGNIELSMTMEDAKYCYHQGSCQNEVNAVSLKDYIQEQLKEYSNPQLIQALKEYAIEDCETFNRKSMEEYIVWLIAGNIIDDYDNE